MPNLCFGFIGVIVLGVLADRNSLLFFEEDG